MTNPGIAAPLSRSRHNKVLQEADAMRGRATDVLAEIDQALAEVPPTSAGRRSSRD